MSSGKVGEGDVLTEAEKGENHQNDNDCSHYIDDIVHTLLLLFNWSEVGLRLLPCSARCNSLYRLLPRLIEG